MTEHSKAQLKLIIELLLMFPFVMAGRIAGWLVPLKTKHNIFLFVPNTDIGGAARVNADIAQCLKDKNPLVILSKKPKNDQFRSAFQIDGVKIIDLHRYIDNKAFHFINFFFRGVLAVWINKAEKPVVFGGESLYFYKVIPHIRKNIPRIELSHLPTWLPYNIGFIERIDLRIFSTKKLMEAVEHQYENNNVKENFYQRLRFVDNAIDIPEYKEVSNELIEVVFIGRGSPQKRVHLIAAIAKKMHEVGDRIHFSFIGDVESSIDISKYPFCKFYGAVTDQTLMDKICRRSDILILTSAFEGLPLAVMTMMAYGKIVLSTAVNAIPDYITHMENGLLIYETEEFKIVEDGIRLLRILISNPELKNQLGKNNRQIAIEKFSRKSFCKTYREILLNKNYAEN